MHDILDDDLSFNCTPSMLAHSRSGSMKKLNKKESIKTPVYEHRNTNQSKTKGFDLIDEFLSKQSQPSNRFNDASSVAISQKNKFESVDLNFQNTVSSKPLYSKYSNHTNNFQRLSISKDAWHDQILGEDHNINYQFGKTQQTIFNPSRTEESFVSARNMKPPIKNRGGSHVNQNLNYGVTIPEEDITVNSSNKYEESAPKPSRMNRRSSIDSRSDNHDDSFTVNKLESPGSAFQFDHIKEEIHQNRTKNILSNFTKEAKPDNSIGQSFKSKLKDQQATQINKDFQQKHDKYSKPLIQDYERQIDLLKTSHQKQLQYLQQTLEKLTAQNRNLREKFMSETSRIIEEERNRTNRIHQEEIERLKEMFSWEKKRTEDTYNNEIQSLRQTLNYAHQNGTNNSHPQNTISKQNLEFLEYQLKSKEKMLSQKQKMLDLRQQDIRTISADLNNQRKREEDRIREEEKRIMDLQLNYKKTMLSQRKDIAEEKRQMAIEMGNLEMELIKIKKQTELSLQQNYIERESLTNQRQELRRTNEQMMDRHKLNLEQLQQQKQRTKEIQIQLTKKLRVVERTVAEARHCNNLQQEFNIDYKRINICLEDQTVKRPASAEKASVITKSMTNIHNTKERFYHLQKNSRSKLNQSVKENTKLDLGGYMTRVQQLGKLKSQF